MIYLDWNATTPPHPDVIEAMAQAQRGSWANPASVHGPGRLARARLDDAREALAALTGYHPRDVVLTSGGTEANNLALTSAFSCLGGGGGGVLVLSHLEHPSVVRTAEALAARGVTLGWARPDASGVVTPEAVADALEASTQVEGPRLVALQSANHETGVIQPVAEVAALCARRGALLHVDAVQAVGKLSPEAWTGADSISVAAHKIRGPKGIGALITRPGLPVAPLLRGGSQERGLRPGTVDPVACAGLAAAAHRAVGGVARYAALASLRDALEAALLALAPAVVRNGTAARLPHVSNLSWPGWRGDELCAALDLEGIAVSSGSACSAGTAEPSPVITAVAGEARARGAVRASLGEDTTPADVAAAISAYERVISRAPRQL